MTAPSPHLSTPNYRPDIDGLRAVAVLSVVAFHAFPAWMKGGFVGVDIFFVISGFLISTIIFENLDRGTFSFSTFYARRIKRIFPALLLVLAASLAFGWFALLADEYKQLGKHVAAGAGFVSNLVLWGESGYFDNAAETKPLLHLWSLGIEEQFYIVWPFAVWLAWKTRANLLLLIAAVGLVSLALGIRGVEHDAVGAFYSPQTRFWELLSGSILAWCIVYRKDMVSDYARRADAWLSRRMLGRKAESDGTVLSNVLATSGALLLAFGFWRISRDVSFPGAWAIIPVLGAVLVIIAGPKAWINARILSHPVAVWFGLISFPLYLWHWPLLAFPRIIEGEIPGRSIRIAAVALSILLAWMTYRLVERPVRFGKNGRAKVALLVALMCLVGLAGYATFANDGFELRSSIRGYVNNKNELIRTPTSEESCLDYIGIRKPLSPYCRFTDAGGGETVAVIGDSHAHVAYPGIAEFLRKEGKNTLLLANSSCPPFLGSPTGKTGAEVEACRERMEQLLEVIEGRDDIRKVFIFTRGPTYTTGTEPLTGDKNVMGGTVLPLEQFASSAQASIDRLSASGKSVYYVSENPELPFDPGACLVRPFKITGRECSVDKDLTSARQDAFRKAFSGLRNVTFIDTLPAFCPGSRCLVFDKEGTLLYADDDHLSIAGSRFQVDKVLSPYLR